MKLKSTALALFTAIILTGCALPLKMAPPPTLTMKGIKQHQYKAGLFIPQELKDYEYVKVTSPLDKMVFPLGKQTHEFFLKNMPIAFKNVVEVSSATASNEIDIIVKPSIVKFESVIPMPAYKPYTAKIVYRVEIYNKKGEKIFAQTTTGNAQTSKGMMSGFMARSICSEVAQMAMEDAMKQIIEGMTEADELQTL